MAAVQGQRGVGLKKSKMVTLTPRKLLTGRQKLLTGASKNIEKIKLRSYVNDPKHEILVTLIFH